MLFLGLGTGLGTALIDDDVIEPMELGHLPFRKKTYEEYVGERARKRVGDKRWSKVVLEVIETLRRAVEPGLRRPRWGQCGEAGHDPRQHPPREQPRCVHRRLSTLERFGRCDGAGG